MCTNRSDICHFRGKKEGFNKLTANKLVTSWVRAMTSINTFSAEEDTHRKDNARNLLFLNIASNLYCHKRCCKVYGTYSDHHFLYLSISCMLTFSFGWKYLDIFRFHLLTSFIFLPWLGNIAFSGISKYFSNLQWDKYLLIPYTHLFQKNWAHC